MRRQDFELNENGLESQAFSLPKRVKPSPPTHSPVTPPKEDLRYQITPPVKLSYLFSEIIPAQLEEQYEVIEELARGACGRVYLALHRLTGTRRAIKHIKKFITQADLKEIEVLKELSHPNIITPIEYCLDTNNLFIVSELCTGGSLFEKISNEKHFTEAGCRDIVRQVLQGLSYIHGKGIVHRDIKPENLMFESEKKDALIKIIDFGLGDNCDAGKLNIVCGTALYVAPEVLKQNYNERCDVWSLGAVLFRMLTGKNMVLGNNDQELFQKLYCLKQVDMEPLRSVVSEECMDLIRLMLTVDYNKRPSAHDLLTHHWFDTRAIFEADPEKEMQIASAVRNLRNFNRYTYLHNIIYFYTTSCIVHNEEKQALCKIFLELDADHDGRLSMADLVIAFQKSGRSFARSNQLAGRIFQELEIDQEEGIEMKAFISVCCSKQTLRNEEALRKAFTVWDSEGKGAIDIQTIQAVLQNGNFGDNKEVCRIGENIIQREIGMKNEIVFEEFRNIMNRFAEDEQMSQSIT